jgi:hypothetical protein
MGRLSKSQGSRIFPLREPRMIPSKGTRRAVSSEGIVEMIIWGMEWDLDGAHNISGRI